MREGMAALLPPLPSGVAYDKADASGVHEPSLYSEPSIRVVLRTSTCPYELCGDYRPHLAVLEQRDPSDPPITREQWEKAVPGPCFGAYPRMRKWLDVKWPADSERHIPSFFAGNVEAYPPAIQSHRRMFAGAAECLHIGRPLSAPTYMDTMCHAKVALCPWGNGELTYRMYEAWHAGAVPVMPRADWVHTWYGMVSPGVHYVPCEPDGSDVTQVCRAVLSRWDDYDEMREINMTLARELLSRKRVESWAREHLA